MYHPAKILRLYQPSDKGVLSSKPTSQALVTMWDQHMATVDIDLDILKDIVIGDIALVDYSPISDTLSTPRQIITAVLKGELGTEIWAEYDRYFKTRLQPPVLPPVQPPFRQPSPYHG